MPTHHLSLPIPVSRFLKRLFNVVSTLAITNQYLVLQRAEVGTAGVEGGSGRNNGSGIAGSKLVNDLHLRAQSGLVGAYSHVVAKGKHFAHVSEEDLPPSSYTRWASLKDWRRPISPQVTRTAYSIPGHEPDANENLGQNSSDLASNTSSTRSRPPSPPPNHNENRPFAPSTPSPIQELLLHPALFDPVRKPRHPLVLCHGNYILYMSTSA